jgi:RNA polymerase sigma-B factor
MSEARSESRWDKEKARELLSEYALTRESQLKDELVTQHLNLVRYLAGKFSNRGENLEDLIQVGCLGLIKAIERFDPERGTEFTTYATPTIVGEIKRHFRDKGWAIKVPRRLQEFNASVAKTTEELTANLGRVPTAEELAKKLGVSAEDVLEAQELGQSYNLLSIDTELESEDSRKTSSLLDYLGRADLQLELVEDRLALHRAFSSLPPRERLLMYLRFFENRSQSEVAKVLNISQMHVSRLQARSLETMRKALSRRPRTPDKSRRGNIKFIAGAEIDVIYFGLLDAHNARKFNVLLFMEVANARGSHLKEPAQPQTRADLVFHPRVGRIARVSTLHSRDWRSRGSILELHGAFAPALPGDQGISQAQPF